MTHPERPCPPAPAPGAAAAPTAREPGDAKPEDDEPGDDELVTGWGLVVEAYARVTAALRRDLLEQDGLDGPEFEVLLRLSRSPEHRQTASQLAAEVSFSSGGFTKLADRLERADLVRRHPCQKDRRVVWIALTPLGEATIRSATAHHVEFLRDHVLATWGAERFNGVTESMRALRDRYGPSA